MKSSEPGNKAQRKVDYTNYYAITMRRNYFRRLSPKIKSENYQLLYQSRRKCEIYKIIKCERLRDFIFLAVFVQS